jgi:phenolic acid decarboxylase
MEILYQVPRDPEPDARIKTVIKAVVVLDGTKLCTIGFSPRHVPTRPEEVACLHNKFAQIIELYV